MEEILTVPTELTLRFLDLKNDYGFKKVFVSEENKEITISLINDIFEKEGDDRIEDITFVCSNQVPKDPRDKLIIPDGICYDGRGNQIILEMQRWWRKDYDRRLLMYLARAYASQLKPGESYENLKDIMVLAVCGYTLFPELDESITRHVFMEDKTYKQCFKGFEVGMIDLPKFKAEFEKAHRNIESLTQKSRWSYYISYTNEATKEELEQLKKQYPDMQRALSAAVWTPEDTERILRVRAEIHAMDAAAYDKQLRAEGRAEGMAEGKTEGKIEGKAELINIMFKGGADINEIQKLTRFSPQQIEALRSYKFD